MVSDTRPQRTVLAELAWDPSVTAAYIGVTAQNGIVTPTGHLGTVAEKKAADLAARRVKGVAEEIEVRLPADMQLGDEQVAACAVDRLTYGSSVPRSSKVRTRPATRQLPLRRARQRSLHDAPFEPRCPVRASSNRHNPVVTARYPRVRGAAGSA